MKAAGYAAKRTCGDCTARPVNVGSADRNTNCLPDHRKRVGAKFLLIHYELALGYC